MFRFQAHSHTSPLCGPGQAKWSPLKKPTDGHFPLPAAKTCILVIQLFLPPFSTFQWKIEAPRLPKVHTPRLWVQPPACLETAKPPCFFSWICRSLFLLLLSALNTLRSLFIFEKRKDKALHGSPLLCPVAPPYLLPAPARVLGLTSPSPPPRCSEPRALFPPLLHVNWKSVTLLLNFYPCCQMQWILVLVISDHGGHFPYHSECSVF